jgi:hypothetical protein
MTTLKEYADEINKRIINNPELANLEVIEYNYIRGSHKLFAVPSCDNIAYLVTNSHFGTEVICYSEQELNTRFNQHYSDIINKVVLICKR